MFKQGDMVVYGSYGICTVSETDAPMPGMSSSSSADATPRTYYVLTSQCARGGQAYVPSDREDLIRRVVDRKDAISLVDSLASLEVDTFQDKNSHTTEAYFRKLLATHDLKTSLRIAKTMRRRIREQKEADHAPSSLYVRILEEAQTQVLDELSVALDAPKEKVEEILAKKGSPAHA